MNDRTRSIDMTGQRYNSVIAVQPVGACSSGDIRWQFKCDCGREFEASGYDIRSGKRRDCPVCAAERTRIASVTHGESESDEFRIWTGMQTRCYNKNAIAYVLYGGRGISICKRWRESFENFLSDMGRRPSKKHSIDRIDNDGNYEPSNCRWATATEQARNKRTTVRIPSAEGAAIADLAEMAGITAAAMWLRVKKGKSPDLLRPSKKLGCITHNGITDTYAGWSERTGLNQSTISMRINKYEWPIEKALTKGATR